MGPKMSQRHFMHSYTSSNNSRSRVDRIQSKLIKEARLPSFVDLSPWMGPVKNQKDMNICVAIAFTAACEYMINRHTGEYIDLSCLFLNYNGRLVSSIALASLDIGSSVKDTAIGLAQFGICEEVIWRCNRRNLNRRPSGEAYARASQLAVIVRRVPPILADMKICLAKGIPFVASIILLESALYEAQERNGYISIPDSNDAGVRNAELGHAVLVVGYNDETQHFLIRNSWGPHWAIDGYCFIPYEYLLKPDLFLVAQGFWAVVNISPRHRYPRPINKSILNNVKEPLTNYRHGPFIDQAAHRLRPSFTRGIPIVF
ncbi:unnamed protein product [Rotaria magnacalcarata]|uniref:Peptidase C1A papain C-terminal domain-containing protein n=4 Tax=Bdelloidea TaxID=44578 RepID=A0A820D4L3_9BILA|nr:unnamed protein product [Rotaria magnacalcarata]CAF4219555.1 unnamed protein product [Rotaria magnacalcarata]